MTPAANASRKVRLRGWQLDALAKWNANANRGIVRVVTGAGKTVFALACIESLRPNTTLVVVPTLSLIDQWWAAISEFFGIALDDVHLVSGRKKMEYGTVNLCVINTAAKLQEHGRALECFLIVDECHKAAGGEFGAALSVPTVASLGLSATPDRPYDDGLNSVLIPALGNLIFCYGYGDALKDGVIVPFELRNIVFELEPERQRDYERLSVSIARAVSKYGSDAPECVSLFLRRTRIANMSLNRIAITAKLVAANAGRRILIFHEDIQACDLVHRILIENGVRAGVHHSRVSLRNRAATLEGYRLGHLDVLVACRALDEGLDVPNTELGIIAASTATRRQRIQRMGRILRPAPGKTEAVIYTLAATGPEVGRLKEEESQLEGVARVSWSAA